MDVIKIERDLQEMVAEIPWAILVQLVSFCAFLCLQVLFVLFEHASGYAIFRCQDVEDIGSLLPEVQEAVLDFARFGSMITLEAFAPFKTGANALENINSISEGISICK